MRASYSRWATFWAVVCAGIFGACLVLVIVVPDTPHTHHARTVTLALSFVFSGIGAIGFFIAALQNDSVESLRVRLEVAEKRRAELLERGERLRAIS